MRSDDVIRETRGMRLNMDRDVEADDITLFVAYLSKCVDPIVMSRLANNLFGFDSALIVSAYMKQVEETIKNR